MANTSQSFWYYKYFLRKIYILCHSNFYYVKRDLFGIMHIFKS